MCRIPGSFGVCLSVCPTLGLAHVRHLVVLMKTSDSNRQLAFQAFDPLNTYSKLSLASSSCQWHMNLHFRVKSFDPNILRLDWAEVLISYILSGEN